FRFHRHDLDAIVARIKAEQIPVGYPRRLYRVDGSLAPDSLRRYSTHDRQSDDMCGKIAVYRGDSSHYLITIVLVDEGHLGAYGLMYCEMPIDSLAISTHRPIEGSQNIIFAGEGIAPHWWYAYNDTF